MGGFRAWLLICALAAPGCRFGFDDASRKDGGTIGGDDAAGDGMNPSPDATIDSGPALCPQGYNPVVNETSRYLVVPGGTMDWLLAEQTCESQGTHLLVLDSANEKAMMIALLPITSLWTGVTDRKVVGQWLKVTGGVASYLPWANSEPDGTDPECVQLEDVGTNLRDQDCGSGRRVICECDGLPAMPSTY